MSGARLGFRLTTFEALGEIGNVLGQERDLSLCGFWCAGHPDYRTRASFDRDRRNMARPKHIEAFRWARTVLLIRAHVTLPPREAENTFDLQRAMQCSVDATFSRSLAVEEGTIVAAAISLGFPVQRAPNGWGGLVTILPTRARP